MARFRQLSVNEPISKPVRERADRPTRPPIPDAENPRAGLTGRIVAMQVLQTVYPWVTLAGFGTLFVLGGFVPVLRRWLNDELRLGDTHSLIRQLGGVWVGRQARNSDRQLGPVLAYSDAGGLYDELAWVAQRLGVGRPGPVRLTFLPCCGVLEWGSRQDTRRLVLGLPLLQVLSRAELRSIFAHELAHLARRDALRAARAAEFTERLRDGLDQQFQSGRISRLNPLFGWAKLAHAASTRWSGPMALGQELRADEAAARIAGGDAAASALVKAALVQSIFREVVQHYNPERTPRENLYAHFRRFWRSLPESLLTSMRHALLADRRPSAGTAHPALIDRVTRSLAFPSRPFSEGSADALGLLGHPESHEQALHDLLFHTERLQTSVFHRAGS